MSEQKKPQAGEWWEYNGVRIRIVGTLLNGRVVCEYRDGKTATLTQGDWWHHEPRCTSWDWQPEPEPEWFDLTPFDGHVLRTPIDHVSKGGRFSEVDGLSGATVGFAKRNGYTQFRCLLKDAPPELLKPVESPDDWVDITETHSDMNPRVGVDWFWNGREFECQQAHDANQTIGEFYEATKWHHRCRRRDLPPIPEPKPSTQREVLLYWYDGNVVGRYADCQPTDQSFVPLILRDGKVFIETETREVVR